MSQQSYDLGRDGESQVAQYLAQNGHIIIKRNFQFYHKGSQGRLGEIDIITEKNNKLHLWEIKTRSSEFFGQVEGQITHKQLQKLFKTYQYFLCKEPRFRDYFCQFDVAVVLNGHIRITENAYTFDGLY